MSTQDAAQLEPSQQGSSQPGSARQDAAAPADVLETLELFAPLDADTRRRVLEAARRVRVPQGGVLAREGERSDEVWLLLDGELSVTLHGRLVTLLEAPRTVGLLAAMEGRPRTASLEAFSDVDVLVLDGPLFRELLATRLSFARAVAAELAVEVRGLYAEQERHRQSLDDFFESPNARLVPGPYVADPVEMLVFVLRDEPGHLRALLPPGATPLPGLGGHYLLTLDFFDAVTSESPAGAGRRFAYREVTPFLPCLGPDLLPGLYCPELYPDNYLAILLGRELYGFPKRFGRIERAARRVTLSAGHRLVLRASWDAETPCGAGDAAAALAGAMGVPAAAAQALGALAGLADAAAPASLRPTMPVLVRKQIADASSVYERRLQIDELVRVPFELRGVTGHALLAGPSVRFFDDDHFLRGATVAAFRQQVRFAFGAGTVVRDYRARGTHTPGAGERVAGLVRGLLGRRP